MGLSSDSISEVHTFRVNIITQITEYVVNISDTFMYVELFMRGIKLFLILNFFLKKLPWKPHIMGRLP